MSHTYPFGIEEEYFLAEAQTGSSPAGDKADRFHEAAAKTVKPASHELLKGQVEVCTEPGTDFDDAHATLHGMRVALSNIAASSDLTLFAAGSHPLAEPRQQITTDLERYQRLESEFGIIASRSMVCATHIHVEVPDPDARIGLMNRLIPFLPLCLALSVASPFWQKRKSGLKRFRLAAFSEWPRMGLPEIFANEHDYNRYVALLVEAGMIKDASFIWWLIRPSTHYPTIELRICDGCTNVRDTVAIAALYRCLVRAAVRMPDLNRSIGPITRGLCAENIWQAQHDGVEARFVNLENGSAESVADCLNATLALVAEDAEALDCVGWIMRTRDIVAHGTSADRQLTTYRAAKLAGQSENSALLSVVRALAIRTIA